MATSNEVPKNVWWFWVIVFAAFGVWFFGTRVLRGEYDYLQTFLLALSFVAVVIYTIDTRRMQQAMVKQTNVSILPVFVAHMGALRIATGDRRYDVIELENIGNGVALNVVIDTVHIIWSKEAVEGVWSNARIVFNPIMSVKPWEKTVPEHQSIYGPEDVVVDRKFDFMDKLSSRADNDYELKVRFSDVLGNRYVQTIRVGVSGTWPGSVVEDDKLSIQAAFSTNPFLNSPLKHLRKRRPFVERRL